ncbi:MAG: response regulator receiver protein [Bacteroidota bacterium]|jgi:CheY-like chemotaxis protein|nr:response regulator receiver protein [Bacteroidota bacterium]
MVYIIDDDSEDLELIKTAYDETKASEDIIAFEDGRDFLNYIELKENSKKSPAYILTDLKMPALDGIQMIEIFRSNNKYNIIPVVMLSTSNLNYDIERAYKCGVNCFLTKPDTYNGWKATVDKIELWVKRWYEAHQV